MNLRAPRRSARGACLWATLLLAGAGGAFAAAQVEGPAIHDEVEYRDVSGNSQAELVVALDRMAVHDPDGQRYYGNTHWELRWNFAVASAHGECRMTSASTDLTVTMLLPRWNPPAGAPSELVNHWNAFAAALRKHEDGHRDIAIAAAREIATRVGGTPSESGCEALKLAAGHLADSLLDEYRAEERRYDENTGHGRTQGAVFP